MAKRYEMITLHDYLKEIDKEAKNEKKYEKEIKNSVEEYLLNKKRAEVNSKIIDTLLA